MFSNISQLIAIGKYSINIIIISLLLSNSIFALTFTIKENSDLIGKIQYITIKKQDTLFNIAQKYDMGMFELMEANPNIKPNKLPIGSKIIIPSAFILPPGIREGIVLNLAELRLYFYHPNSNLVSTYPVGIGRTGWITPTGATTITKKRAHPQWTPPTSIRNHYKRKGKILPKVMPAGPNNPLGDYAINLAWPGYLIHGTNQQNSVGLRSSSGCIRMYAADIKELFTLVDKGIPVNFIHDPFKIGKTANNLFLEAHRPLPEDYYDDNEDDEITLKQEINNIVNSQPSTLNWHDTKHKMQQTFGYPVLIGILQ